MKLLGCSAILDCVAWDEESRLYNLEIQRDPKGAKPERARYHRGLLDMNTLDTSEDYEKLPETHTIFLIGGDTLGYGQPQYHVRRTIDEVGETFGDREYLLYVDVSKQDTDTELGRLMHDLLCPRAEDMYSPILAT